MQSTCYMKLQSSWRLDGGTNPKKRQSTEQDQRIEACECSFEPLQSEDDWRWPRRCFSDTITSEATVGVRLKELSNFNCFLGRAGDTPRSDELVPLRTAHNGRADPFISRCCAALSPKETSASAKTDPGASDLSFENMAS